MPASPRLPTEHQLKILVVKLSSLGDVVHAMPAVQDMCRALPEAQIDWVVEKPFAPLVRRCHGLSRVIESELRAWRQAVLSAGTRAGWAAFRDDLRSEAYDAVIDLQGLTKSALVARVARLDDDGRRYALANQTEGSSYERPTRWAADVAVHIEPRVHAVTRSRELCARSLGYALQGQLRYGLLAGSDTTMPVSHEIAFLHGTSREDKEWPEERWVELGFRLLTEGRTIGLPHGNDAEQARSQRIARAIGPAAHVWPRLPLDQLTDTLSHCAGAIGVDSGLSHVAVALDLPHVQIYNFDTAWRTGPIGSPRQTSVFAAGAPEVGDVWSAWQQVARPG
jgi:heptosyltransferase-1